MEDRLMTVNTKSSRVTSSIEVDQTESIEKKQTEPLQQDILHKQLSLARRLLNWRTIVPLVIVMVALIFLANKANIDPKKIGDAIRRANMEFFLAAIVIYYTSFPLRALRWRILL